MSAAAGGLLVAVFNFFAFRQKHEAETDLTRAQTQKAKAEAEQIRAALEQLQAEQARRLGEISQATEAALDASVRQLTLSQLMASELFELGDRPESAIDLLAALAKSAAPGSSRISKRDIERIVDQRSSGPEELSALIALDLLRVDHSGDAVLLDAGRRAIARRRIP